VSACCPPGRGCNAPNGAEPCALELCRAVASIDKDAALALARWRDLEQARVRHGGDGEPRFRRRAYERTRDRALISLAMSAVSGPDAGEPQAAVRAPARRFRVRRRGGVQRPTVPSV